MMIYRVTFRKRFNEDLEEADQPQQFVEALDGVVLSASKAEVMEPPALHSQDVLDEDDAFLGIGVETWDYEVAEGRDEEFTDALKASGVVLDYQAVDDVAG
jgi:hypothetical protein